MKFMKKRDVLFIVFFLISLLIFIFPSIFFSPFQILGYLTNDIRSNLYSFAHAQSKDSSYQKLEAEVKKLREQILEMENIKKDNVALRSQFQETFIQPERLLPARVIGFKGKYTRPSGLLIDQGKKSGIKENAAVIVGKELIGKIGEVFEYNAEVILINSPKFSTLVYDGKTSAPGIITGQEDVLLLDHVVITDEIKEKDPIYTKGEVFDNGAVIPEGLLVGSVKGVEKSETKPFQTGVVESGLRVVTLLTVFVVSQ